MCLVIANSSNKKKKKKKKTQKQSLRRSTSTEIENFESLFLIAVWLQIPKKVHLVIAKYFFFSFFLKTLEIRSKKKDQYRNRRT